MLRFAGGQYDVTADDRLWLLRAVQAEGPPRVGVAQALVNGFAWARGKGKWKGSLAGWVRSYAQPVNPRWFTGGDLFKKQFDEAPGPERSALLRRAAAREAEHSTLDTFSPETTKAVDVALSQSFASDVTDYAAPTLDATRKGYVARSVPTKGENRLWTRAVGWTGYFPTGGGNGAGNVAVVLLVVAAAWWLTQSRT